MSLYQKMVLRFWPRNTLKVAYLQWQAQEIRLAAARRRLEHQYQATRGQAGEVLAEVHQGILQTARVMLDQPPDPGISRVQGRLQKAFALRGQGFWQRTPPTLQVELRGYTADIKEICRRYGELENRLRLTQAIIRIFAGNPEFCRVRFFRLAAISPESAWLLLLLRNQRLKNRLSVSAPSASLS